MNGDDEHLLETEDSLAIGSNKHFAVNKKSISDGSNGPFSRTSYVELPGVFDYLKAPGTSDIRNKESFAS